MLAKFVFNKLYLKFFLNFLIFSSNTFFDEIKIIGFLKLFDLLLKVFRINSKNILYDNILSDEGGRFYHSQIKYMACKLDINQSIELPERYIWLSQNQIVDLIYKQKIDIEARLLFGIINFKETI